MNKFLTHSSMVLLSKTWTTKLFISVAHLEKRAVFSTWFEIPLIKKICLRKERTHTITQAPQCFSDSVPVIEHVRTITPDIPYCRLCMLIRQRHYWTFISHVSQAHALRLTDVVRTFVLLVRFNRHRHYELTPSGMPQDGRASRPCFQYSRIITCQSRKTRYYWSLAWICSADPDRFLLILAKTAVTALITPGRFKFFAAFFRSADIGWLAKPNSFVKEHLWRILPRKLWCKQGKSRTFP